MRSEVTVSWGDNATHRFALPEHADWAQAYACAVSTALAKPVVRVEVATLTIGY